MTQPKFSDNVILTGFMGTGKTTVGRLLAETLKFELLDTDVYIEETSGKTIPEIFASDGEKVFRQLERNTAHDLSQSQKKVISTGGRFMLDPENVALLQPSGRIFCLTASPEEILRRVLGDADGTERPLLKGTDPRAKIIALLEERQSKYEQFPQVDTEGKTPEEIRDQILKQLNST